jgi:hypothetical protein
MMTRISKAVVAAILFGIQTVYGQAAAEPPLEETVKDQVKDLTSSFASFGKTSGFGTLFGVRYTDISSSSCNLSLTETRAVLTTTVSNAGAAQDKVGHRLIQVMTIPLSKVSKALPISGFDPFAADRQKAKNDGLKIDAPGNTFAQITISTVDGAWLTFDEKILDDNHEKTRKGQTSEWVMLAINAEVAGRIAEAIAHAIDICAAQQRPL